MYKNVHVKFPLFLSGFNKTRIFSTDFRKILEYKISQKSAQWEPRCSVQKGGRTDRHDDVSSRFSQFNVSTLKTKRCFLRHYQCHSQFRGRELSCAPQLLITL